MSSVIGKLGTERREEGRTHKVTLGGGRCTPKKLQISCNQDFYYSTKPINISEINFDILYCIVYTQLKGIPDTIFNFELHYQIWLTILSKFQQTEEK